MVAALAVASLIGWFFELPGFTSVVPGGTTMKVNSAICFLLLSIAIEFVAGRMARWRGSLVPLLAGIVFGIAFLTLLQHVFGWDLGVDELLWRHGETNLTGSASGRMSLATAGSFLCIATAFLLTSVKAMRAPRTAIVLASLSCTTGLLTLVGYFYGAATFYQEPPFFPVALNTSICFLMLGAAFILSESDHGFLPLLRSRGLGGFVGRRLLPVGFLTPFFFGWVFLMGRRFGWYTEDLQWVLFALTASSLFVSFVWWNSLLIEKTDRDRERNRLRFQWVVEAAPSAMIVVSKEGKIILVNRQAELEFGCTREELMGQPIESLVPSRFSGAHVRNREAYMKKTETRAMGQGRDLFARRRDGTEFPVEIGLRPFEIDGESVVLAVVVNITERKNAESRLIEKERNFRSLADSMPQIVWITGADAKVEYFNRRWHEYTGSERLSESVASENWVYLHPDDVERSRSAWEHSLQTGIGFQIEYRLRRFDGVHRWFLVRAVPVPGADGRIEKWYGTCTDIDDLKAAETRIAGFAGELENKIREKTSDLERAVEALQGANNELDSFTYSVSHDLRAPLRSIDGFSRILIEDFAPSMPEEARAYLDRVRFNTQKMGQLVDDLLAFSRLGRKQVNRRAVRTKELVNQVLTDLQGDIGSRRLLVQVDELPDCVADPDLLRQVWVNLLSNAVKYTRHKEEALIHVGFGETDGNIVYWVKDNGVGFDMRYVDKLFGVFQRLHRQEEFEGTGVGLAIVQRVITRHGGRVWAEAAPGIGATFYFNLNLEGK